MERHVPVHALPEAIRKMPHAETVCKYCGVSYLILHEFKGMEEKVKAMEKEIQFYEGSLEREKALQEELQALYQGLQHYQTESGSKTERIKNLTVELQTKQDEFQKVKEDLWHLQEEKEAASKQSQVLRSELDSIKDVISTNLESWAAMKEDIFLQIRTISKEALAEIPRLNERLAKCQREKECLQEKVKHLAAVADTVELQTQQLQTSLQQGHELQSRCHGLQKETLDLTNQVETMGLKLQKVTAEMEHYKKLLRVKSAELDACQKELKKMKDENSISESRELMLVSHQNSREQLQQSLREKMRQEESWGEKLQMELAKGEAHHSEAILKVREEARLELDLERQKHQELITKYQRDHEELQKKLPGLIASATTSLRGEAEVLQKKLQEAQTKLAEREEEKEKAVQSLKSQVTELEFQLTVEKNKSESLLGRMRKEIKHKSDEVEKLTQERIQLIHSLGQVQEEKALLQETVRRECEERHELTAALTQAREQVLELKKLSGNFPFPACSLARGSLTSCGALLPDCGAAKGLGLQGHLAAPRAAQALGASGKGHSSLGLPSLGPARGRTASLSQPRSRMAAALSRQRRQL